MESGSEESAEVGNISVKDGGQTVSSLVSQKIFLVSDYGIVWELGAELLCSALFVALGRSGLELSADLPQNCFGGKFKAVSGELAPSRWKVFSVRTIVILLEYSWLCFFNVLRLKMNCNTRWSSAWDRLYHVGLVP
ncbi:hypothetical protein U1Q18_003349 [Sarracenia purpurea var. burkii]